MGSRRRFRDIVRTALRLVAFAAVLGGAAWAMGLLPGPLIARWNPFAPLVATDPPGPFTRIKLGRAAADPAQCLAALQGVAGFTALRPFDDGGGCGIAPRVRLTRVGAATLAPIETTCATALRLAMWERHAVQDAAARQYGQGVAAIGHQGSYNCRPVRGGGRLSSHATAMAIDVNAVVLEDGRRVTLLGAWDGDGADARFWRDVRNAGCRWFVTVLGPAYDAAHADHLHLQASGWGLCR